MENNKRLGTNEEKISSQTHLRNFDPDPLWNGNLLPNPRKFNENHSDSKFDDQKGNRGQIEDTYSERAEINRRRIKRDPR